jgi:hypothetical protein
MTIRRVTVTCALKKPEEGVAQYDMNRLKEGGEESSKSTISYNNIAMA